MKAHIEQFWFKYAQLQYAVRNNDCDVIDVLDRELEPALLEIYQQGAANSAEARAQFQFLVDLIRIESDDMASVIRNSKLLQSLISRYFADLSQDRDITADGMLPASFAVRTREFANEGLLNEVILDSLPDRIAVITPDYRYVYSNTINAATLDQRPIDMIGRHLVEFIGLKKFEQRVRHHLDRCFAGEKVDYTFSKQVQGHTVVVRCRMTPCRSSKGQLIGAIVVIQDQADRRRSIAA